MLLPEHCELRSMEIKLQSVMSDLSKEAKNKFEKFCEEQLPHIPFELLQNAFMHIYPRDDVKCKNDIKRIVYKYGRIAYNHLYISFKYTLPWIVSNQLECIMQWGDSCSVLQLPHEYMYMYLWINPIEEKGELGDMIQLTIENSLYQGYLSSGKFRDRKSVV